MRRSIGDRVRQFVNKLGVDIYRYPMLSDPRHIRRQILDYLKIDVVLDVGANIGQFGSELRNMGFGGRIESFEPVSGEFQTLTARASSDATWKCHNFALGSEDGTTEINVAGTMSSILPKAADGTDALDFAYSGKETIRIFRLDGIRRQHFQANDRAWMKIDVQGFEMAVLNGATQALTEVLAVELELSLKPFYAGQTNYTDMTAFLNAAGFDLWSLRPASREASGRMVEMDGIFVKRDAKPA